MAVITFQQTVVYIFVMPFRNCLQSPFCHESHTVTDSEDADRSIFGGLLFCSHAYSGSRLASDHWEGHLVAKQFPSSSPALTWECGRGTAGVWRGCGWRASAPHLCILCYGPEEGQRSGTLQVIAIKVQLAGRGAKCTAR